MKHIIPFEAHTKITGSNELSLPEIWNVDLIQVCSHLTVPHCSLRDNGLTATGAIALARALQQNKSLEELK